MTNTVNFKEIAKSKDPKQIAVKVSKSRKKSGRAFYYVNYRSVLTVGSKDNGQRFFQTSARMFTLTLSVTATTLVMSPRSVII